MKKSWATMNREISQRCNKNFEIMDEFDAFYKEFIDKHKLPFEMYRSISYLMCSYVTNREHL